MDECGHRICLGNVDIGIGKTWYCNLDMHLGVAANSDMVSIISFVGKSGLII